MRKLLAKYPRLSGVVLGAFLVLVTNGVNLGISSGYVDKISSENERLNTLHREYVEKSSEKIESLRNENSKLKSKSTTYRLVKPDGTIEERTSNEVESEETLSESVRAEWKTEILEKMEEQKAEWSKLITESKKLSLGVGVSSDLEYYGLGSYTVWPPFTINGIIRSGGTVGIGIGMEL